MVILDTAILEVTMERAMVVTATVATEKAKDMATLEEIMVAMAMVMATQSTNVLT